MASKKDLLSGMKKTAAYSETISAIETATAEPPAKEIKRRSRSQAPTAQEVQEAREAGKTQGRKGCKAVRINMAFSPDVHDYIKTMSKVTGKSVTQFTNDVFRKSMIDNADLYEKAQQFAKEVK